MKLLTIVGMATPPRLAPALGIVVASLALLVALGARRRCGRSRDGAGRALQPFTIATSTSVGLTSATSACGSIPTRNPRLPPLR